MFSETAGLLYNYIDDRTGEPAPLIADDVYCIIQQHADQLDALSLKGLSFDFFGFKTRKIVSANNGKIVGVRNIYLCGWH